LSSRRYKNFNEYIEAAKELITSYDDIIAVAELEEFEVTLNEGFIGGTITFIDGSRLHFLRIHQDNQQHPHKTQVQVPL